jgi:hypothetical protein
MSGRVDKSQFARHDLSVIVHSALLASALAGLEERYAYSSDFVESVG